MNKKNLNKIGKSIQDFFVNWFWWKWRALKYDRDTNKDRDVIFEKLFSSDIKYIYIGFGSVLLYHRNNTMKNQDLDILISKDEYFKNIDLITKRLNLKKWSFIYSNDELIIAKYLYKNRTPVEFFLAEFNGDKEITKHVYNSSVVYKRIISKPTIEVINFNGVNVKIPKDRLKYVEEIYSKTWNKPASTLTYDWTKDSNTSTLEKTNEIPKYEEF